MIHSRAPIGAVIGLAIALVAACKDDPVAIAVLTETSVGTEKQTGTGPWAVAAVGTKFFRGDAVQTADGTALLSLGPTAALRVQPRSLIRFGEEQGKNSIAVELGEATLEGSGGTYQLGLGTVTLEGKSAVKITSGEGGSRLELMLGAATLESNGDTTAMAAGESYQLGMGTLTIERPDARPVADAAPPDAVPDAAIVDAAPLPPSASVSLEITGKKATYLPEGAKDWIGMPAGSAELTGGSKLKLGPKTTAKARHPGVTLELPSGARLSAGGDPFVKVDAGAARAIGEDGADGKVGMPGGFLILDGDRSGASIEVKRRETEIEVTKGTIELHGKQGKTVLQQGETALLRPDGGVKIMNEVPKHFDLRVTAGDSFTVHDPKPRPGTAVRFTFDCGGRGVVELGKGGFNAPRVSAGTDGANLMIPPKTSWRYRVRCDNGRTIANGKVLVRSDDGRRQLPKGEPPTNSVEADGFNFKIHYQNLKPKVLFRWKKATGSGLTLHVTKGADDKSFPASGNSVIVQGSDLEDGIHNFYFTNSAGAKSPVSSLDMQYDNATPSAYIEEPKDGVVWPGQIPIKGATLPGWTASVEGTAMPVDRQGRFETSISPPAANAIAIRLSHSRHGVHYYLRRQ